MPEAGGRSKRFHAGDYREVDCRALELSEANDHLLMKRMPPAR
jgi:hypothetical protein